MTAVSLAISSCAGELYLPNSTPNSSSDTFGPPRKSVVQRFVQHRRSRRYLCQPARLRPSIGLRCEAPNQDKPSLWRLSEKRFEDETRRDETSHYLSGSEKYYDHCISNYLPLATVGGVHAEALTSRPMENTTSQTSNCRHKCDRSRTAKHPLNEIRVCGRMNNCMHVQNHTTSTVKTVEISVVGTSGYFTNTFSGGATTLISSTEESTPSSPSSCAHKSRGVTSACLVKHRIWTSPVCGDCLRNVLKKRKKKHRTTFENC